MKIFNMNSHKKIQNLLYEYLQNELTEIDRTSVEQHINSCSRCKAELESLKETIARIPSSALDASKNRTEEYWNNFAFNVERKLADPKSKPKRSWLSLTDLIDHMFFTPRPYVAAFGSAMAVLICILALFKWYDHNEAMKQETAARENQQTVQAAADDSVSERVYQYVRQSKMLLVGVTNMKPVSEATYDLSMEQQKSRQLIYQARYLKHQPLDDRTAKLVDDLQKILIELANMKEQGNAPNVDIIRGGLHDENLLFKIRMAEDTYNPNRENRNSY
ncbi:MAG: anti-sigma factor family protein [Bacteroidota bacterium]